MFSSRQLKVCRLDGLTLDPKGGALVEPSDSGCGPGLVHHALYQVKLVQVQRVEGARQLARGTRHLGLPRHGAQSHIAGQIADQQRGGARFHCMIGPHDV